MISIRSIWIIHEIQTITLGGQIAQSAGAVEYTDSISAEE